MKEKNIRTHRNRICKQQMHDETKNHELDTKKFLMKFEETDRLLILCSFNDYLSSFAFILRKKNLSKEK